MDLIEAKIAEIKNLNLIYIFTTDNILKNNSDKYVGARVLYDKDKTISLDYKSPYFQEFIKKILSRYNKEKNKRKIILLGDLTKKLVKDSFFTLLEENKEFIQSSGILVNSKKNQVKSFEKYLEKTIKSILNAIKNYEYININSIDGFNYKYVVNYSVGKISKRLYMLIFINDEGNLNFKISNIDGTNVNINGEITDNFNNIDVKWYDDITKLKGIVIYDSKEKTINESLYKETTPIIVRQTTDTLLDDDENLIAFYMNLCNLKLLDNIMKIDDNSYLLSSGDILLKDTDNIVYNDASCSINIFDNLVIIKNRDKNGISKYNNQIQVVLDDKINEFTLKKIKIEDEFYILVEKKSKINGITSYSYSVLKINGDKSLFEPFEIKNKYEIEEEFKTFDKVKQYIKNMKGGK